MKFSCQFEGKLIFNLKVEKACQLLHLNSIRNYVIRVQPFTLKENAYKKINPQCNLFLKNLPHNSTSQEICELFNKYGRVVSFKLKQNRDGQCLGYGYVQFEDPREAENAIRNLDNFEYKGNKISVDNFSKVDEREEEEKFPIVFIKQLPLIVNNL